jgi:hypothetical protein
MDLQKEIMTMYMSDKYDPEDSSLWDSPPEWITHVDVKTTRIQLNW